MKGSYFNDRMKRNEKTEEERGREKRKTRASQSEVRKNYKKNIKLLANNTV